MEVPVFVTVFRSISNFQTYAGVNSLSANKGCSRTCRCEKPNAVPSAIPFHQKFKTIHNISFPSTTGACEEETQRTVCVCFAVGGFQNFSELACADFKSSLLSRVQPFENGNLSDMFLKSPCVLWHFVELPRFRMGVRMRRGVHGQTEFRMGCGGRFLNDALTGWI